MAAVISGVVRGQNGQPVANARIGFANAPVPVPDIAALTDDHGTFTLFAPAPGKYVIGCYADGYAPANVAVDIVGSEPARIEIGLEQSH
ncbi:MAG: carboxypeptidase-like regulatory domain-containing protein [Caldilineaceae bacterium]